jgi:hypothetical protein
VTAAVPEARLVTHEDLAGAELVAVWAGLGCQDDPRAGGGAHQPANTSCHTSHARPQKPHSPKNFWEVIQSLLHRVGCLWALGMGAGESFASDYQHRCRTLRRPAERTKIEASSVAIRGIVKGVAR